MPALSELISIKQRYSRSINLERDVGIPDSMSGYIPTPRVTDSIGRFLRSREMGNSVRAWTLTGSYGTGKSAFALFLTALCAPHGSKSHARATKILRQAGKSGPLGEQIKNTLPESGLVRAVATAQREPIANTVLRALDTGVNLYWQNTKGRKPDALKELYELIAKSQGGTPVDGNRLIQVIVSLAQASRAGILLVIDELGKNLEFAAQNQSIGDLYLLQQIAELPANRDGSSVSLFGLLHQSFIDYAHGITSSQRNEWAKIQGRFEDVLFVEPQDQMVRLIGQAIDQATVEPFESNLAGWVDKWQRALSENELSSYFSKGGLSSVYPLHPLSALVLPGLCTKYSQNNRTLFTFLSSGEHGSFSTFLSQTASDGEDLASFKLHKVYDYFVESAGMSVSSRPRSQRWIEIQLRLSDANNLDPDFLPVLKTIGLLNLVSSTGFLRASRSTVALAMCNLPGSRSELRYWGEKIQELMAKGFVIYRERIDELRIWEGSDFDIEREISGQTEILGQSLADLLNEHVPLEPLVVQRHSYQTGTLRYFERRYYDRAESLTSTVCQRGDSDGLICYWVGNAKDVRKIPEGSLRTPDDKPVLVISASKTDSLRVACQEYVALESVRAHSVQLQTDGVARREVSQRILHARRLLRDALSRSFDIASGMVKVHGSDGVMKLKGWSPLQSHLSDICDNIYGRGPFLWNELINKRELTPQGASARNKLVGAMLDNAGRYRLDIAGNGPEYSMFESVLIQPGLYTETEDGWEFSKPLRNSKGIYHLWRAIEKFCKSAKTAPKNVDLLYGLLQRPPYGAKEGPIPVLLLSVLLYYSEYISVYHNGTFIPVLGPEHLELLVKKPETFSVKYLDVSGLRAEVFHELAKVLSSGKSKVDASLRNKTILGVVRPLVRFVQRLPQFALKTESGVTKEAKAVSRAILDAREPDDLLFSALPLACGLPRITGDADEDRRLVKRFRKELVKALSSLQAAYGDLLGHCEKLIKQSFAIKMDAAEFRQNLRYRAMNLSSQVIEQRMKSFILAASDDKADSKLWLESLLLIVTNKTPKSWTDEDVLVFETKLSDIARRFANLEALQKDIAAPSEGIEARRITLTYPDGDEIHQMLWIDRNKQESIEQIAERILESHNLSEDLNLGQAVAAALMERIFPGRAKETDTKTQKPKKERGVG